MEKRKDWPLRRQTTYCMCTLVVIASRVEATPLVHVGSKPFQIQVYIYFLIVCFASYFLFRKAVLPHSRGVVYYHLLLRRETRIPGVAPFSFRIGIWDLFVHRGQTSYTPRAFGKLWTTPGERCMKNASSQSIIPV